MQLLLAFRRIKAWAINQLLILEFILNVYSNSKFKNARRS